MYCPLCSVFGYWVLVSGDICVSMVTALLGLWSQRVFMSIVGIPMLIVIALLAFCDYVIAYCWYVSGGGGDSVNDYLCLSMVVMYIA